MMYFEDEKHSCYKWKSGKAENLGIAYGVGYGGLPASQRWAVWLATIELTEDGGVYTGSFAMPGQASTLVINTGENDDYNPIDISN